MSKLDSNQNPFVNEIKDLNTKKDELKSFQETLKTAFSNPIR
jgi:hypothetical protein